MEGLVVLLRAGVRKGGEKAEKEGKEYVRDEQDGEPALPLSSVSYLRFGGSQFGLVENPPGFLCACYKTALGLDGCICGPTLFEMTGAILDKSKDAESGSRRSIKGNQKEHTYSLKKALEKQDLEREMCNNELRQIKQNHWVQRETGRR